MSDFCLHFSFLAQTPQDGQAYTPSSLLVLLVNPFITWILAILICTIGVFFWYRFSVHGVAKAINGLTEATRSLRRLSAGGQFAKNLDDINKSMMTNSIVKEAWNHYTDSLLITSDRTTVRSGRDPHFYFNENLLSSARINMRFYYAVPSYLVGLGLICTFIGLVAALFIASMALDQDPKTIQVALQNLLKAAAFKFTTSIAGLGSSLFFSYGTKVKLMEWQDSLDAFCNALLEVAPVITAETLAYEALAEQQRQTHHLSEIQNDLAGQFATALDAKLQTNLVRLVDPLTKQIDQVVHRMAIISQETVVRMVQEFREQLFAATQDQMQHLLQGLSGTNVAMEKMNSSISRSADHFSSEIGKATEEVFQKITAASLTFETALHPLHKEVRALTETFAKVDDRFKSQLDLFTAAIQGMHSSLEEFRKTAKVLEGVSTPIHNATQELDAVARRMHESNVASMHALEQLAKFSDSLNKTAQQTRETWDIYRQRFEKVDEDLKGVVDQLGRGFRSYHDIVENFMKQLDQSLSHSTSVLSSSVQELAETMENIEARNKRAPKQ